MKRTRASKHSCFYKKAFLVMCAAVLALASVPVVCFAQAGSLVPNFEEGKSTTTEETEEVDISSKSETEAEPAAAILAAAPLLQSTNSGVGTLSAQLSNDVGGFDPISSFAGGSVDWDIQTTKTLKVDFEFNGSSSNKAITISVPKGYRIVGYTATDSTAAMDGVEKISIDPLYASFFQSSSLTAIDGTSWVNQKITGYLGKQSASEKSRRVYAGNVRYTFSNATTAGTLVLTLVPQCEVMKHTNASETETLGNISITMSSSSGSVSETFHANVTDVAVPVILWPGATWGRQYSNVAIEDSGLSERFGVNFYQMCYGDTAQEFLSDQITVEIQYPAGVYYDNYIQGNYIGAWDEQYAEPGTLLPGHITLTDSGNRSTGGTIIITINKSTFYDGGWNCDFGAYFRADTTTGLVKKGDKLSFPITIRNSNGGEVYSTSNTSYRTLISDDEFHLDLWGIWKTRWDINADYPEYDRPYVMGGFTLDAYTSYKNIPLHFDFSDLLGVQGMLLPGRNIRDIKVVTTKGNTYTISSIPGVATSHGGVSLEPETIGLQDDEYIKTLDCLVDLEQYTYGAGQICSFTYLGHFVDGQEGDVWFSVLDKDGNVAVNAEGKRLIDRDHTTIGHDNNAAAYGESSVGDYGESGQTFEPNDTISFKSYVAAGYEWAEGTSIVNPTVMISLPEGINLDTTSVQGTTWGTDPQGIMKSMVQVGTPKTEIIDNVKWTTYYYQAQNPMDLVAYERGYQYETLIEVFFEAHVASNCPQYGQISLKDCIQWDVGADGAPWTEWRTEDIHNRAGKGTDYHVYGYGGNFSVKDLIGLNVDLGIRVKDSGTNFYSYDTTENSIAGVSTSENAEVGIGFENTGSSDYQAGSTIYLPIPKIGNNFSKYFQNIELKDPYSITTNTTFEFTTNLASEVVLPGFTTYYSTDAVENTEEYDPSYNAGTWAPVTGSWKTYAEVKDNLESVTMLKFVANSAIPPEGSGSAVFELSVSNSSLVGQLDYWRAYTKAVTNSATQSGVWFYSSVLAATPANNGVIGQVFVDNNIDGYFDAGGEDEAYSGGAVTAILSRDDGSMANLKLAIGADGSFRSLTESGKVYHLKKGAYTITFTNNDSTYPFSTHEGTAHSSKNSWYNDIPSSGIEETVAKYHFTVENGSSMTAYVGVGLDGFTEVISIDVPVRVVIATNMDGTWCTPTALKNMIINHSTCAMHVASANVSAANDFRLVNQGIIDATASKNAFAGTITPGNGSAQALTSINTSGSEWSIPKGLTRSLVPITDHSNELALQLAGKVQNVEGKYLTAPVHAFDITYTFEKAGE